MRKSKVFCVLLLCMVLLGSFTVNASAMTVSDEVQTLAVTRATGQFSTKVPANSLFTADGSLSLAAGETVTISASYTPSTASVDFGLIAPDGLFYSVRGQNGRINKTIQIDISGEYTFAIRNNSNSEVSASGTVRY